MPKNELFGKHIDPACCYCEHSLPVEGQIHLNCRFKGRVDPAASCRRFSYDPLKRIPPRPQMLSSEGFEKKDFEL